VKALVVAELLRGEVQEVTWELIAAARSLGCSVIVALIGKGTTSLVDRINVAGVDELFIVSVESAEFESDVHRQAMQAVYAEVKPQVILMGFTINSIGYGPALAAQLGLGFASDVFAIRRDGDGIIANRAFYGGKVVGELEFPNVSGVLLLLRRGIWEPVKEAGSAVTRQLVVNCESGRTRHLEFQEATAEDQVDISSAEFLLCVGRGIGKKENLGRFEQLAEKMGATLAVSRPLVDAGWVTRARQVGQSGKTVRPKVYLSFGVSGAVQHVAGMKSSGVIIAINSDPEASIFNVARYGAVVDLFEVADELEKCF